MINNTKTNDWFTSVLFNQDKDIPDLVSAGLNKDNTGLQSRDFYKNKSRVQEIFSDLNGKFDEVAFNQFYNSALRTYNDFVTTQIEDNFIDDQIFSSRDIDIESDKRRRKNRFDVIPVRNPMNLTTGTTSLFGQSESEFTSRELALTQKVYDPSRGMYLDYTPNDAGGQGFGKVLKRIGNAAFGPTLALAVYDEDGEHQLADGRVVKHRKGDLKYNADDLPYYEVLGDRSPYGREILHVTDILTVDGSTANKFDFFDSDSKDKSVVGSTARLIASIAPVVIKGTKTPYAYLTAAHAFGSALTGIFKAADEWLEGGDAKERSTTWKTLNSFESYLRRFDNSVSDESQTKMLGWENFFSMLSDIVLLLYQQRAVAQMVQKTPSWLNMGKKEMNATKQAMAKYNPTYTLKYGKSIGQAIKDGDLASEYQQIIEISRTADRYRRLEKLGARGADMSKLYMAVTQSGDIVETMDEAGFTPEAKVVGTLAALYGFKKIFDSELGDLALKGFGFDDVTNSTRKFFLENVGAIEREIALKTGLTALSKTAQLSLAKKFGNRLNKVYRWGMDHPNEYLAASFKEATEEITEELLQDGILISLSALDNVFRTSGENEYDFFESNPAERYLMSALGGALGGPIFTGVDRLERGVWGIHKSADPNTRETLIQHIRDGKSQEILSSIDRVIRSNKSGLSTQLSARLAENLSEDGKPYFLPSESEGDSQAWVLGENIKGWVRTVDSVLNSEGYAMKDDDVIFKVLGQNARLNALVKTGVDVGILNDFKYNLNNLLDARLAQKDMEQGDTSTSLTEKYNNAKRNIDSLITGERADYYTKKLAFMMSRMINSSFIDADIEMYAIARGIDYNALSEDSKVKLRAEYDQVKGSTDELLVYNWSEIAFRAYQNMEQIIAPTLIQFGNNYAIDPVTGQAVLDQNFSKYVLELQEVFPSTKQDLTPEERSQILEKYREGKTDLDILEEMNPTNARLSDDEKKDLINRYLSSNVFAAQELEAMSAAKWVVQTFGDLAMNPESLKYGLDPMVMLKTRELLRETLNNIRMIMLKYNINYIDSRTSETLLKMEKALNNIDIKDTFTKWANYTPPSAGVSNIVSLLIENGIENFSYTVKGEEDGEVFEVEGEGFTDESADETWTIQKQFDPNGVPIIENVGKFTVVNENGIKNQISIGEITNIIYELYFNDINNVTDFLKAGQAAMRNTDAVVNTRLGNPNADVNHTFGDFLLSSLFNEFGSDFQERLNIIDEAEQLRRNVLNNPIYDALRKASELILGVGEDVFTLIQREEEEIGKRSNLQEYVLSDLIKGERLAKSYMFLQAFKNVVNGRTKSSLDFDFNETVDSFLSKYKKLTPEQINSENPTITPEIAAIINRDLDSIAEKLEFLIALDLVNNSSKFQDSAKSLVRMNALMIKALTGQLGNKFGFVLNAQLNGEQFFNFEELGISDSDMQLVSEYINPRSSVFSDEAIELTESILTKVKSYIYNKFNSENIDDATRKVLLIQMMDGLNLNVKEQRIDLNMTNDNLNPFTAFTVLLSTISSDPIKFRTIFTEEIGELIPYSMLMFNAEVMCAYADNNKWFAAAMDEVNGNPKKYFPGKEKAAAQNEAFSNVLFSWGNAGAGKTVFLANMVAKQFSRNNKNAKIWVAGPNQDRATNLTTATGVKDNFDRTALFRQILTPEAFVRYEKMMEFVSQNREKLNDTIKGKNVELYEYYSDKPISIDINGETITLSENTKRLDSDFISSKDIVDRPDLLIIDEITKFDTFELLILDRAGIKVIALGDRSQVKFRLFGKPHNPDGAYMNTAELAMSVRSTNIHKKDNHSKLGATLNILLDQFELDQLSNLSERFEQERSLTTFTYYETEENGSYILNGEKIVNKLNVFSNAGNSKGTVEGLIQGLKDNEIIVYIHNPGGRSDSYTEMESLAAKYPNKIEFKTLDDVLGKEYKYAIVDINFTELVSTLNLYRNDELIDSLTEFNTAMSRSMDGTIVVDNKTSPYHVEHALTRGYTSPTGDSKSEQAVEYAQKIIKIIVDTTPKVEVTNENVPTGQPVKQTTVQLEQEETEKPIISTSEFIATNAALGTFYNHMSVTIDGDTYTPSGLREDLGIFEIRNRKEFDKLRKGLSYLRSYIITSKINGKPITVENFGNVRRSTQFADITRKLVGNNVGALHKALNSGMFLIKLSSNQNPYSLTYNSINKSTTNTPNDVLGRIVYQIKDSNGDPYDITIGAISEDYVRTLLSTGKINGSPVAKPEGNASVYFSFSEDPNWTINTMKPLTKAEGYNVNENLSFKELKESHPELIISDALIANDGKHKGRPFAIYSYNLFDDTSTETLAELRNRELNKKGSDPNTNMTTSVIYLDRIGYTIDEWINLFGDWISVNKQRQQMGYFTGYMTATRLVVSMIDYHGKLPEGELKTKLSQFLSGRIDTKMMSSRVIDVSKTKDNIDNLVKWIEENKDNDILSSWLNKGKPAAFDEEKFLKSSKLIADKLKSEKTVTNIIDKLKAIRIELTKGTDKYGDITPEIIDEFVTEINNLALDLRNSSSAKIPGTQDLYVSELVKEWLSNGILIKASKMNGVLYDIHKLWNTGMLGSEDAGTAFYFDLMLFLEMMREIVQDSRFFKNGMIYREGKAYRPDYLKDGILDGTYYFDSNPESNFTVNSNIQLPSVYFNKVDAVDLNGFTTQQQVTQVVSEETKPATSVSSFESLKSGLLELQTGNITWERAVNRVFSNSNLSPELLYNELESMVTNPNVSWRSSIEKVRGINLISERPEVVLQNGEVTVNQVYTPLKQKYTAISNDTRFDLNTINITDIRTNRDFDFTEDGITYRFSGNEDGTFRTKQLTRMIDSSTVNEIINSFVEEGSLFGEDFESIFTEIGNTLTQRYADVNKLNEDLDSLNLREIYQSLMPTDIDPDIAIAIIDSLELKFDKLKCI